MNISGSNILLLGANGGIGSALARVLSARGARLLLAGLGEESLKVLVESLPNDAQSMEIDIAQADQREALLGRAGTYLGSIDILINAVGVLDFLPFEDIPPQRIEQTFQINTIAPILFMQSALPGMRAQGHGLIVNIGSTFGSIGFPYFSVYSASKFALRGFSEALRRELADTGIDICYVAPRATKTPINNSRVMAMGEATKMNMDPPEKVAQQIARAIENDKKEVYLGQPESFFARVNQLLPRLVDRALFKQRRIMEPYARS